MTTSNDPKVPEGLLERCFSTIPDGTTYKPVAPRLSPDSGSRVRLRWLSVAAAVPVVMVAAVLPIRNWITTQKASVALSKNTSLDFVAIAQKQGYIRIDTWYNGKLVITTTGDNVHVSVTRSGVRPASKKNLLQSRHYRLWIMDRSKGIFMASDLSSRESYTMLQFKNRWGSNSSLPNKNQKMISPLWDKTFNENIENTLLSALKQRQKKLVSQNPEQRMGEWEGRSAIYITYQYRVPEMLTAHPDIKMSRYGYIEFIVSPETGLLQRQRRFELIEGKTKYALMEDSEYHYKPWHDESDYFDLNRLKDPAVKKRLMNEGLRVEQGLMSTERQNPP